MKKARAKVLWMGDAVTPTGFSRVNHSILKYLSRELYDVDILGINYYGDPHPYSYLNIYPAGSKGHIYGFNRVKEFENKKYDLIFILNDLWIIHEYLNEIKKWKKIPKIVCYTPLDSTMPDEDWFKNHDAVSQLVVYTQFGYDTIKEVNPKINLKIIPHGVDTQTFYKINKPRPEIKNILFPNKSDFVNSWIVLNANRNQPRKRIDISFEGFAIFAKGKPLNVKYYHHAGISDVGWDVLRLAKKLSNRYGYNVEERLIVTNMHRGVQSVAEDKLNLIYNATDVGLNTSLGEGWGLTNIEHTVTGVPQIVPDHSSCRELFHDCGLLIPISQEICFEQTITYGKLVTPESVAIQLEKLYQNPELQSTLAESAMMKFTDPKYHWKNVTKEWHKLFQEIL